MAGYTKLFSTILASTIWREPAEVRVVWITMLAMADASGRVDGSVPGLADLARVSLEQCQSALKCLGEPDFFSRTKENEGRRIREVPGGWEILNYLRYRESGSDDLRREQNREAQRRWRAKHKLTVSKPKQDKPRSAQAEAEAEAEAWLSSIAADPANKGIDVPREADKCRFWCGQHRRQFTRRTFVNWLLRADRTITTKGNATDQRPNSRSYEQRADYSGIRNHGLEAKP